MIKKGIYNKFFGRDRIKWISYFRLVDMRTYWLVLLIIEDGVLKRQITEIAIINFLFPTFPDRIMCLFDTWAVLRECINCCYERLMECQGRVFCGGQSASIVFHVFIHNSCLEEKTVVVKKSER